MNRIHIHDLGGADYRRNIQITPSAFRWPNANGAVSKAHMKAVAIRLRVHCDRGNAQVFARADNPQRNFATIGDQNFLEHDRWLPGADREQRFAVFHGPAVFHQLVDDRAGHFGLDFVHQLHRLNNTEHLPWLHYVTGLHKGRGSGRG